MPSDEVRGVLNSLVASLLVRTVAMRSSEELFQGLLSRVSATPAGRETESGEGERKLSSPGADRVLEAPMARLAERLAEVALVARLQAESVEANTRAVIENSLARATEGKGSTAGGVARTVLSLLGSGLGVVRLLGRLFGGEERPKEAVVTRYVAPAAIEWVGALSGGRIQGLDYGQGSQPRVVPMAAPPATGPITIQVQAIDSRSFLDHSAEIARAVKEALLQAHTLGDVVLDL